MIDSLDRYIRPLDLDALRRRFRQAEPFPHIVIDDLLQPDFVQEIVSSYPSVAEAESIGNTFRAVNESGKTQVTDASRFAAAVARLNEVLAAPEWRSQLEHVTGIPDLLADELLDGGGMHIMRPGSHLDVHIDFNLLKDRQLHRRLNIIVFFNPEWHEAWGGQTELWDRDVKSCHHSVLPVLNRCVIFETSQISFHGVKAVRCPSDQARRSFAAYYYTKEAPAGWDGTRHTTVFRARPEERVKRWVLMPAHKIAKLVRKPLRKLGGRG